MIYLLEDDESIRELVIYTLKSQGYEAKGFERPSLFWKELEKELPSLLLLDVMLPEIDIQQDQIIIDLLCLPQGRHPIKRTVHPVTCLFQCQLNIICNWFFVIYY